MSDWVPLSIRGNAAAEKVYRDTQAFVDAASHLADGYFARAESAERRLREVEAALRDLADDPCLNCCPHLALETARAVLGPGAGEEKP